MVLTPIVRRLCIIGMCRVWVVGRRRKLVAFRLLMRRCRGWSMVGLMVAVAKIMVVTIGSPRRKNSKKVVENLTHGI